MVRERFRTVKNAGYVRSIGPARIRGIEASVIRHQALRNRNFAVLVTNQDGERVCRVPLDLLS